MEVFTFWLHRFKHFYLGLLSDSCEMSCWPWSSFSQLDDHNSWSVLVGAQRGYLLPGQPGAHLFPVLFCSPGLCSLHNSMGGPLCIWLEVVGRIVGGMDWIYTYFHCGFSEALRPWQKPDGPTVIYKGQCPVRNKWDYNLLGSWVLGLRQRTEGKERGERGEKAWRLNCLQYLSARANIWLMSQLFTPLQV